jgi:hypothetical protein
VAVALETQGAEAAVPWVRRAGATYPTVVDQNNVLSGALDFKAVPNGVFLDEDGTIRYAKYGGFSIERPEDRETIHKLIHGEIDQQAAENQHAPYTLTPIERELVETKVRLGSEFLSRGDTEGALAGWRQALDMDPENLVIRKQIWAVSHPERFHPTIDWDWQKEQLRREREEEVARGVCGPDGCPLPPRRDP